MSGTTTPPDSVPDPPADLPPSPPPPHIIETPSVGATYGSSMGLDKDGKGERRHPTDPYEPLKKRRFRGCCGCFGGSLLALALLFIVLAGAILYLGPGRFVAKGYDVVNLGNAEAFVDTPPERPTVYIGRIITYRASVTIEPVAIFAQEIIVSGNFFGDASLTGVKVTATGKANFSKNLEVYAAEFFDHGSSLKGELSGRVMRNRKQ